MTDRVVALIDMDCFYCQVETRLNPELKGLPLAVVQYNEWKGGGIIAVNYEARDRGVTRHMRGSEARQQCPEIILAKVPMLRDKADLTRYREAGREVVDVLCTFSDCVERASVDEAYIDLTAAVNKKISETSSQVSADDLKHTYVVGYTTEGCNNEEERQTGINNWLCDINDSSFQDTAAQRLAVGAVIIEEIREAVLEKTGFNCSAGVAHNKILAKLACGLHKPNRQTVVPLSSVPALYKNLPAKKVRSLGGKLGNDLTDRLGIKVMADLLKFSESDLQKFYDVKTGSWLYNIARGYDYEPVNPRLIAKSIGCRKNFPGRTALSTGSDINHWIRKLSEELVDRLNEDRYMNKRRAQLLTISMGLEINKKDTASSKSAALTNYNLEKIITLALNALKKSCSEDPVTKKWSPPIKFLGLSAGKFTNETSNKIINFFKNNEPSENSFKTAQTKLVSPQVESLPIHKDFTELKERLPLQNFFNKSEEIIEKLNHSENYIKKRPSFFEKILLQGKVNNTETKLNILPDLNKLDLPSVDENSRESITFEKLNQFDVNNTAKNNNLKNSNINTLNNSDKTNKRKDECDKETSKINKNSISSFFNTNVNKNKWIDPEEIFPNLNEIDEEIINMFPLSFRRKILELKKSSSKTETGDSACINNNFFVPSCSNTAAMVNENNVETNIDKEEKSKGIIDNNEALDCDLFDSCSNDSKQSVHFNCNECGETIPIAEQSVHMDLHVAIKLDNELNHSSNITVGNNLTNSIINVKHRSKRKKKDNDLNSKLSKKGKGIEAFFKK